MRLPNVLRFLPLLIDLTPDISKQSTSHDQVHYSLRFRVDVNRSCEIYYLFDSR